MYHNLAKDSTFNHRGLLQNNHPKSIVVIWCLFWNKCYLCSDYAVLNSPGLTMEPWLTEALERSKSFFCTPDDQPDAPFPQQTTCEEWNISVCLLVEKSLWVKQGAESVPQSPPLHSPGDATLAPCRSCYSSPSLKPNSQAAIPPTTLDAIHGGGLYLPLGFQHH